MDFISSSITDPQQPWVAVAIYQGEPLFFGDSPQNFPEIL